MPNDTVVKINDLQFASIVKYVYAVDVAVCFCERSKRFCVHVMSTKLDNGNDAKFNNKTWKNGRLGVRSLQRSITGLPLAKAERPVKLCRHIRMNRK